MWEVDVYGKAQAGKLHDITTYRYHWWGFIMQKMWTIEG